MQKFTAVFRFPVNLHSNSAQAIALKDRTPESHPDYFGTTKICVIGDTVYWNQPKHYIGVINLRAKGGVWEECPLNAPVSERCEKVTTKILEHLEAVPANFRGAPRIK
ncbi:TPA: hypothetical protein I7141_19110 [Vibrio vulnificus]|nr:hypothetical protein [Vibrio vulnificus]